ncbi:MAG: sialate O-acetylesterase, partial [Bacteroidota bacterium]
HEPEKSYPFSLTYFDYSQTAKGGVVSDKFGPERSLKDELMSYKPLGHRQVFLVKYAIGGSSMLDWAPDYSHEKAKITGNVHFGNMFETFFQYIDSIRHEYNPEIKALLWMQGERDARIPEAGKEYYNNFKKFIQAFRKRIGNEKLPIIFAKVNPPKERYAAVEIVNEAQKRIADEMEGVYMIETEGLGKFDDEVHYNTEGQLELGKRFAAELIKHLE